MNRSISLSPTKMTETNGKFLSLGDKVYDRKSFLAAPILGQDCGGGGGGGDKTTSSTTKPKSRDTTRRSSLLFNPSVLGGKLCLITDGCSDMGVAIAKRLVHYGAHVVLAGPNMDQLKMSASQVRHLYPDMPKACVRVVRANITDQQSVKILFHTIDVFTDLKLGLVINNAQALPKVDSEEERGDRDEFYGVMNGTLLGPYLCSREAMKRMKASEEGGRIINIGGFGEADPVAYNMAKFALLGLTQSLAVDGRPHNVAAGFIHPANVLLSEFEESTVATEPTADWNESIDEGEAFASEAETSVMAKVDRVPAPPTIKPEDVAKRVVQMACLPFSVNVLDMTVLANLLSDYDKATMPIHAFALNES